MTGLAERVDERDALLRTVSSVLADEPSVDAAWLFGSLGRGEAGALSDIDLAVVVPDELAANPEYHAGLIGDPLLVMDTPEHAPEGGAFFTTFLRGCAGPQAIDWLWVPRSIARRPVQTQVLLDRYGVPSGDDLPGSGSAPALTGDAAAMQAACSFWSMILWGAKLAARSSGEGDHLCCPMRWPPCIRSRSSSGVPKPPVCQQLPNSLTGCTRCSRPWRRTGSCWPRPWRIRSGGSLRSQADLDRVLRLRCGEPQQPRTFGGYAIGVPLR